LIESGWVFIRVAVTAISRPGCTNRSLVLINVMMLPASDLRRWILSGQGYRKEIRGASADTYEPLTIPAFGESLTAGSS